MNTDISTIKNHVENLNPVLALKANDKVFQVTFTDVTKTLKSGAVVFKTKKEFREEHALKSGEANRLYAQTLNHFGRIEAQRHACAILLDNNAILSKDAISKTGKRTLVFEARKEEKATVSRRRSAKEIEAENEALRKRLAELEAKLAS